VPLEGQRTTHCFLVAVQMFILYLHCSAVSTASVVVPETSVNELASILLSALPEL